MTNPLYMTYLIEHATEFTFSPFPELPERDVWSFYIKICYRGTNQYAITNIANENWTHDGHWEYERQPSSRTEEFYKLARWTLIEATDEVRRLIPIERARRLKDYPSIAAALEIAK